MYTTTVERGVSYSHPRFPLVPFEYFVASVTRVSDGEVVMTFRTGNEAEAYEMLPQMLNLLGY